MLCFCMYPLRQEQHAGVTRNVFCVNSFDIAQLIYQMRDTRLLINGITVFKSE